jgi:hypothetical protein
MEPSRAKGYQNYVNKSAKINKILTLPENHMTENTMNISKIGSEMTNNVKMFSTEKIITDTMVRNDEIQTPSKFEILSKPNQSEETPIKFEETPLKQISATAR